jgi:futalosine hydrolase
VQLSLFLARSREKIDLVVDFGVAGAYVGEENYPKLLDICLAEEEIFGDFGYCSEQNIKYFTAADFGNLRFHLDRRWLKRAREILAEKKIPCRSGSFITVNCASASLHRGNMLQGQWNGLCENMEGASVARVCREFTLPCLEIRAVSNYVEDRDTDSWLLSEAAGKAAEAAYLIVQTVEKQKQKTKNKKTDHQKK